MSWYSHRALNTLYNTVFPPRCWWIQHVGIPATTICDALQANAPGHVTFAINSGGLAGAAAVGDADVIEAMRVAFETLKLVLEPSGALGLAALISGQVPLRDGEGVAVVACGGNVALPDFLGLVQRERTQ